VQKVNVQIKTSGGAIMSSTLSYSDTAPWRIQLDYGVVSETVFDGDDLFACLCSVRRAIEHEACQLLCNGARLDAYPSPMSREMGGGRMVYLLQKGQHGRPGNLVDAFAFSDPSTIATVEEQKKFYFDWLESLK
jgi:hypothetical protein